DSEIFLHGLQIWVALPKDRELMEPEFFHIDDSQIPSWTENNARFKLIAGEALGRNSPVPVFSKLFMIEIKTVSEQTISIGEQLYGESGLYILEGAITNDGSTFGPKQMLVAKDST